jgi:glycosyltransferase involved in cell wall biosynthesis
MKILQVTPILDPDNLWTGPHRVVFDISKRLSEMGNKVTVCTSDMLNKTTRIRRNSQSVFDGFEIVRVRNISRYLYNASGLLITPDLRKFLSERIQDYDVIHIHEYTTYQNIVVHKYAEKCGVPYILQVHGSMPRIGKKFRKWLYYVTFGYTILQDASKEIALTRTEAQQYRDAGVPEEKIAIIPNGIDLSGYADLPPKGSFKKKFGLEKNDKIVLYLGRIHEIKGIDILVKAFANILHKLGDVRLVIVGPDVGYLGEIVALTKALQIEDKVLVLGPLYGVAKLEAYVDADVYVLPSRYETFPMTVLEAYACGKPVIASKVGGLKDLVVNGETGLLFDLGNTVQLAKNILYLLDADDQAEEMGLKGKQFVKENFTIDKVADKLQNLYRDVASHPSAKFTKTTSPLLEERDS